MSGSNDKNGKGGTGNDIAWVMDQIAMQQLQMALTFEKIIEELSLPDEQGNGLLRTLEKLLAPLVSSSAQIMDNLGIPATKT